MPPSNYKTVNWAEYELLSENAPNSLAWASRGSDGSGKSYFACTAPDPMFVAAFDPYGMNRVDKAIRRGKEIRVGRYTFNPGPYRGNRPAIMKAATEVWDKFVEDYRVALRHCRTVIWDREDMAWALIRYAFFGGLKNEGSKTGALDYGEPNEEYISLIQEAKAAGVNVGLLQGLDDKWEQKFDPQAGRMKNMITGTKPDGFKKVAAHVDITIDHRWDETSRAFLVKFDKFPNTDERGMEYPNIGFLDMACAAFPDSTPEDWGAR